MRPSIASLLLSAIVCTAVASPTSADDRKIASQIAEVMRVSGAMKKYDVGIKYSNGTAWLRGRVADQRQADTAVQIARASPHVQNVVNQLAVSNPSGGSSSGNQVALTAAATPMQTQRASPIPFSGSTLPGSPQQMIRPVAGYAAHLADRSRRLFLVRAVVLRRQPMTSRRYPVTHGLVTRPIQTTRR